MRTPYLLEPTRKLLVLVIIGMIIGSKSGKCLHSSTPLLPLPIFLQELRNSHSTFSNANNVQFRLRVAEFLNHVIEDVIDMLRHVPVSRDGVLHLVETEGKLYCALLGKCKPGRLRNSLSSSSPPHQLAHVCQDDTGGVGEGLDVLDHVDSGTGVDSAWAADDAVGEDAEVIFVLIEEYDDAFLGLDVGRDEDREVWGCFCGVEWEAGFGEAEGGETVGDDVSDCFCWR